MNTLSILGSTGSIGCNTLAVVRANPDRFQVLGLSARNRIEELAAQVREFHPRWAVVESEADVQRLATLVDGQDCEILWGETGLTRIASDPAVESVMSAIVGAAGLLPTMAAVGAAKRVLLANKEPLVMAGEWIMAEAARSGAVLLPVDSEHNAIFQCLPDDYRVGQPVQGVGVTGIVLTASGGPFLDRQGDLESVTPEQACAHPNWRMGPKISVDSATLMNKGLELIEASRLFAIAPEQVQIVIHPQSLVHSLVQYQDGSLLAQLGPADMCTPIAHALAWPQRIPAGVEFLDLLSVGRLDFHAPDEDRFPCLRLARQAIESGGTAPTILNAANEVAVAAFLDGEIAFTGIPRIIRATLERLQPAEAASLGEVMAADRAARETARAALRDSDRRAQRS
ncbi:MAG: 1-deoxy-D-xylulose-5-phosphate reductoisomerase [Gammaproteobacteria bacterium]|nr:1-deoxy-D-xylulose-5-phosphate reductoisomerase [Gammaproteobacteria bacterium]